jgi:hypothetical protein
VVLLKTADNAGKYRAGEDTGLKDLNTGPDTFVAAGGMGWVGLVQVLICSQQYVRVLPGSFAVAVKTKGVEMGIE